VLFRSHSVQEIKEIHEQPQVRVDLCSEFNPTDALELLDLGVNFEMAPQLNLIFKRIIYYYIAQVSTATRIQAGQPKNRQSFFSTYKRFVSSSQL
jgi:hypothetical protein